MAWKNSGDGEGNDFYRPEPGMKLGQLLGTEDGPELSYKGAEPQPQVRWKWNLFEMDKTPLMWTPEGATTPVQAQIDALSTEATGPKSKARKWAVAHRGAPIDGAITGSEFARIIDEECIGKFVYLFFGPNENGRITVTGITPAGNV